MTKKKSAATPKGRGAGLDAMLSAMMTVEQMRRHVHDWATAQFKGPPEPSIQINAVGDGRFSVTVMVDGQTLATATAPPDRSLAELHTNAGRRIHLVQHLKAGLGALPYGGRFSFTSTPRPC